MIEKIKKLIESTNYEDNRLGLILIAETYTKQELLDMSDEGLIWQFGVNRDKRANGLCTEKYALFLNIKGPVTITDKLTWRNGDANLIIWNLKETV